MWEDGERKIQGSERGGRVKDNRDPAAIKMSVCAEANAHLPSPETHTQTYTCIYT